MANDKDTKEDKQPIATEPADTDAPSGDQAQPANDGGSERKRSGAMTRNGTRSLKRYVN